MFLKDCGVRHITSSPLYPQSNGLAERTVQTLKGGLVKAFESGQTLLDVLSCLRSTPLGDGLPSPAVLLQSRNLRDAMHCCTHQLQPVTVDCERVTEILRKRQDRDAYHNAPHSSQAAPICVGMKVWCEVGPRKWVAASVVKHDRNTNSFIVRFANGRTYRRNRRVLRPVKQSNPNIRVEQQVPVGNSDRGHSLVGAPSSPTPQKPLDFDHTAETNHTPATPTSPTTTTTTEHPQEAPISPDSSGNPGSSNTPSELTQSMPHSRVSSFGRPIRTPLRFK